MEIKMGGQVATVDNVAKCHLPRGSGGMPPRKILKFSLSEMLSGAF